MNWNNLDHWSSVVRPPSKHSNPNIVDTSDALFEREREGARDVTNILITVINISW